jgi:hypothetical protein
MMPIINPSETLLLNIVLVRKAPMIAPHMGEVAFKTDRVDTFKNWAEYAKSKKGNAELNNPNIKKFLMLSTNFSVFLREKETSNKVIAAKETLASISATGPRGFAAIFMKRNDPPQIAASNNNLNKLFIVISYSRKYQYFILH